MNNYEAYTAVKNAVNVTNADPTKVNWIVVAIVAGIVVLAAGAITFVLIRRRK